MKTNKIQVDSIFCTCKTVKINKTQVNLVYIKHTK